MANRVELRIKMSPTAKAVVDNQVRTGRFRDAGDVLEVALMRAFGLTTIRGKDELVEAINVGLKSGPARAMSVDDWSALRQSVKRRGAALRKTGLNIKSRRSA